MNVRELARLFRGLRRQFRGTPAARAELWLLEAASTPGSPGRVRDAAYAVEDPPRVVLLVRALRFSRAQVEGLLLHELGHLADPALDRAGREVRADAIAYVQTGHKIRYSRPYHIQTTGQGISSRPAYLHQ